MGPSVEGALPSADPSANPTFPDVEAGIQGIILLPPGTATGTGRAGLGAEEPDLILHNGKVLTVDDSFSVAQAVAITGNKISAVGTDQEVLATAGPNTQKIDLEGRTVTPGLVDTHRHMYAAAEGDYGALFPIEQLNRFPVDWRGVKTKDDVMAQVKGRAEGSVVSKLVREALAGQG